MINIIHHEERENGKVVRDDYTLRKEDYCSNAIYFVTKEELIELRDKLNKLEIK
jgi:hypothetical protein